MSQFPAIDPPADLIQAAARGDTRAQEALYRQYQRPVYTLIRRLISRAAIADELFQDTFVEILRSVHAYCGEGTFSGWVRSIALSKCLMYLRSPWHRSLLWLDADPEQSVQWPAHVLQVDGTSEPADIDLERALARLPVLARTIVWLHDVEGYTHVEIARLLNRTPSFSKSQLARAHARLREHLGHQIESLPCTPVSTNC